MKKQIHLIGKLWITTVCSAVLVLAQAWPMPVFAATYKERNRERLRQAAELRDSNTWKSANLSKLKGDKAYSKDQVIVKFKNSALPKRTAIVEKFKGEIEDKIGKTRSFVVDIPNQQTAQSFIKSIQKDAGVEYAELDYRMAALGQQTSWGFDQINAAAAHGDNNVTGNGVTVAVVDTGVDYLHEDLDANIWENGAEIADNDTDDDGNGYVDDTRGWDFIGELGGWAANPAEDNDPMDGAGHGTHVSGIVAAEDNGSGIIGAAPDATIMPVKVLDDAGFGLNSTIASGIRYAADNGADVINLSLGGLFPSRTLREAINYAVDNGVAVAVAAGNEFGSNLFASFPAVYPNVITVAASDEDDQKTWWSNYGKVDVTAPGEDILSSIPEDRYTEYSGTSMATPFVAGTLALIKEANPGFNNLQLRHTLEANANELLRPGKDYLTGNGLLDAEATSGALSASLALNASSYRIIADDGAFSDDTSTITARILDENGDPVMGEEVTFTADVGTITGSPDTTDADGVATAVLTADDVSGVATVTATTDNYGSQSLEVLLFNDKVQIAGIHYLTNAEICEECESDPDALTGNVKPRAGEGMEFEVTLRHIGLQYLDAITLRTADLTYELLDSDDNEVLSGAKNNLDVDNGGFGYWSNANVTLPITLPEELASGRYSLVVTVTDEDSGKSDSASFDFNIGGTRNILVVPNPQTPYTAMDSHNVDVLDAQVASNLQPLLSALDNLGENYDVWPYGTLPNLADAMRYPVIIVTNAHSFTIDTFSDYLAEGGNLYISGNTDWLSAVNEVNENFFGLGTGWCANPNEPFENEYFTCVGANPYPTNVSGSDDSIFDGMSFDIDGYNLAGDGAHTQLYVDEFELKDGAPLALEYSSGVNDPAAAGFAADNGTSNFLLTGFGIEGVHNNTGAANTREDLLEAMVDFFRPAGLTVSSVSSSSAIKGTSKRITISGEGFVTAGKTTVTLGGTSLTSVDVLDRNTLRATIPANYPSTGLKNIIVTNPFGQSDTLANAVRVRYPAPFISSVSPKYGSNDRTRSFTVTGKNFRHGVAVKIGGRTLERTLVSSTKIVAKVPKGVSPGIYNVYVKNSDSQGDSLTKGYRVRYGFTSNLKLGMSGVAVKELEKRLKAEGYFQAGLAVDDYFGSGTVTAVRKYQQAKQLPVNGILDTATRNYLNNH